MQSLAPDSLSFDTAVVAVDSANVVLEGTSFYAQRGLPANGCIVVAV